MKFDCGPTYQEKKAIKDALWTAIVDHKSQWHKWFAWFPVRVGSHDCRWLEHVERRGEWSEYWDTWSYEYRRFK